MEKESTKKRKQANESALVDSQTLSFPGSEFLSLFHPLLRRKTWYQKIPKNSKKTKFQYHLLLLLSKAILLNSRSIQFQESPQFQIFGGGSRDFSKPKTITPSFNKTY